MTTAEMEAFFEVIENLEIINNLTENGKKLIKRGVRTLKDDRDFYEKTVNVQVRRIYKLERKIEELEKNRKEANCD